jgi:dipeptidyl aminopeptidase/acylaminoacyl peptidase
MRSLMPETLSNPERVAPHIEITPRTPLVDECVRVRLLGFAPHTRVTIRAQSFDGRGGQYQSHATFLTNDQGVVDVSAQQPLSGSYEGVDAMGLVWSRVLCPADADVPDASRTKAQSPPLYFTAEVEGKVVASTTLERAFAAPEVTKIDVRDGEVVGTFFLPARPGSHPGCLVVGGSSGGMPSDTAALLASHGYPTLALAYFAYAHLPKALVNIPLEYFATALRWMQAQETVRSEHLAVLGWSRGGELALLLGATFPQITAVVVTSQQGGAFSG